MANRRASVWRHAKVNGRWKYVKPTYGRNNKIRPEPGTYYVKWYDGRKTRWYRCSSAASATYERDRREAYLHAVEHGLTPKQQWDKNPPPKMMSDLLPAYLEEYRLTHWPESHGLMKQTLEEFYAWNKNNLVETIRRVDLLQYRAWLMERKRTARTAANKMLRVNQFIRWALGLGIGRGPVTAKGRTLDGA